MTKTDKGGRLAAAVTRIRERLGDARCLVEPADVEPYVVDFRRLYRQHAAGRAAVEHGRRQRRARDL